MRRIARPLAVVTGLSLLIGAPAIAATAAPAAGTTVTAGACTSALGVTVVVDDQGSSTPTARCVTNADGSAYSSTDSLQTFQAAGFVMTTKASPWGATVCKIDGNPVAVDPCGANPNGKWWSFWTAPEGSPWAPSSTGAESTAAPAGSFVAFSYVDGAPDWSTQAPAPRVDTKYAAPTTTAPTTTAPTTTTTTTTTTTAPTSTTAPTTTTTAPTTTAPGGWNGDPASAADWLARQAAGGAGGFAPSTGVSPLIDAYLGIATQNPADPRLPALWSRIAAGAADLTTYVDASTSPATTYEFGSQTAKLLVAAETAHADVHNVGGIDLPALLARNIAPAGSSAPGTVLDAGSNGNVFGQSYAVIGQARIGQLDPAVLSHLIGEQCTVGYFRMYTRTTASGVAPCDASNPADGTDVDGTAIAVLALVAAATNGTSDRDAIDRAVAWLIANQKPGGGFAGSAFTPEANANSTGLAVLALIAARDLPNPTAAAPAVPGPALRLFAAPAAAPIDYNAAISAGRAFVASLQAGAQRDSSNALSSDFGAIAYLPSDYTAATTAGLAANLAAWQRATTQGIFALVSSADALITRATTTTPTGPGSTTTSTTGSTGSTTAPGGTTSSGAPSAGNGSIRSASGALASTGSDAGWILALGLLLALVGLALLLAGVLPNRRREVRVGDRP